MGPLQGIKVLDLSRILAGPWATQVLADYGAEVWKIERPEQGDDTRHWGPPFLKDQDGNDTSESAYYLSANRGKHSLTIDITQPEGQQLIHKLVLQADIVVENFKVGALEKYQLDYASLKAINPKIIYCSITGFGQTGPDAAKPGYDAMIQAKGGLMSLTGIEPGKPGAGPQKVGVAVADLMTGMYAVTAILAALHHKNMTGIGQHIDLALLDTQVAWLANQGMNYLIGNDIPEPRGTAHPNIVPYQSFAVSDGFIMLAVGNDSQFQRCCQVLGFAELGLQAQFKSNQDRVLNRDILLPLMAKAFSLHTMDHWLKSLNNAKVPCGPINSLDKVYNDAQIKHRNMVFTMPHETAGSVTQVANPVKFSVSQQEYQKAPPTLGADSLRVLTEKLNLTTAEIDILKAKKII